MKDCDSLKEHTANKHTNIDLETFIPQKVITKDIPIKIDIENIACKICPENMNSLEDLVSHIMRVHGGEYDETAGVCLFPFVLHKEIMKCVLCDNRYDNFSCMMVHMHKEHVNHLFICQNCGLSFMDKTRLKRHISKSHLGHRCSTCGKIFEAFHKLEKHKQRIHGHVKTFECDLCSATFENRYQVKVHMGKVHNVEKYRIKCEYCPKICTTKGAMLLHVQSLHSEVRFECDLCDYKTGIKWMIKLHRRKHSGEKNYCCTLCERRFSRSSNLRTHMKVHTGKFGRVCRWCQKGFTDDDAMNRHEIEFHYFNE